MKAERIGIVGLGVNNRPLVPFLLAEGYNIEVFDRRPESELVADIETLVAGAMDRVTLHGGAEYLEVLSHTDVSTVYVSPGVKKFGPRWDRLRERGVRLTCETDLFLERCPAPVLGITGSAGKTTTTTLVGESLRRDGRRPVFVGGNIGQSLLPRLKEMTPESWVVLELSSFQLDLVVHSPHGAAFLNLRPNHLDVHRDFEDYKAAKTNILRYQSAEDWAVLPYGDDLINPIAEKFRGRPVYFSLKQEIPEGAYYHQNQLWWRDKMGARAVVSRDAIKLLGDHNIANALAAMAMVASAGGDLEAVQAVLSTFHGVPHRLEMVGEVGGVTYINDSIATAPDRTMAALASLSQPIVLILGGYDKKLEYDTLAKALSESTVRGVVLLGEIRAKIERVLAQYTTLPMMRADGFDEAVMKAGAWARPGDVVLLSPAAASYDMFSNFEARGQRFREMVGIISHSTSGLAE